jgi:BirA family transcriptional regulator, biotin operon repressor / biotin---[acetyl-CoA-carboxylase] ligase
MDFVPRTGLYFSFLLRPEHPQRFWPLLTYVVSLALHRTLGEMQADGYCYRKLSIDLKWPNDVLLSGKKAAGILLETSSGDGAVVGVGINVSKSSVPEWMKEQATSIGEEGDCIVPRRRLLVRYLQHLRSWYRLFENAEFGKILKQWEQLSSMCNDTSIWVQDGEHRRAAITCGLSESGGLKIRTGEGGEEILLAGDVSVRRL